MAGGIGSRFWPFSRTSKPKQFLDILGTGKTLIQDTYNRCIKIIPNENIYIVSNKDYKNIILEQIPGIKESNIISEPLRRNTAPCIAYSNFKILSKNPQANIVVTPSDHLIVREEEFLTLVQKGLRFVEKNNALLTLGIKPSRPETGYGYIQTNSETPKNISDQNFYTVKTFTEKPDFEMAKVFFESGEFYWNSGIFFWSLPSIMEAFEKFLPDVQSLFAEGYYNTEREISFIQDIYPRCESISIDYGIMEKAKNVFVLKADFGWSDLGTWGSMYEHSNKDNNDNAINGDAAFLYDVRNCIVNVPKSKIAVIQGLKDYIIVDSENVLLICKKQDEQKIRDFMNDVKLKKGDKYI